MASFFIGESGVFSLTLKRDVAGGPKSGSCPVATSRLSWINSGSGPSSPLLRFSEI